MNLKTIIPNLFFLGIALASNEAIAADTSFSVKAADVGNYLKNKGVPFTSDITDGNLEAALPKTFAGTNAKAGIMSRAVTATDDLDVDITVFRNDDLRNQARLRQVEACPGCAFIAECGSILVTLEDGKFKRSKEEYQQHRAVTNQIDKLLSDKYGCK